MHDDLKQWLESLNNKIAHLDAEAIIQACEFVDEQRDLIDKLPFDTTPLALGQRMAEHLTELECDSQTIAAALAYPTALYKKTRKEQITKELGNDVSKLIFGAQKMESIHELQSQSRSQLSSKKADTFRKMLLAIVDDARIVLIKLAEQLTLLKHVKNCSDLQRRQVAREAMNLYAPLANRLGIGQLKWQLEDLSFRYLEPDIYTEISKSLKLKRQQREDQIQAILQKLNDLVSQSGIKSFSITGRAKHIYSIHRKIARKKVDISQIYDTSAFRILVPSIKDCYEVLSIIHSTWEPIPQEFDDYIAKPKPNGYRSIHTAVIGPDQLNIEIQMRTFAMHEEAELGVAAHWKYKEGKTKTSSYEDKINWLREVMSWQQEMSKGGADQDVYNQIFEDRVYVFTPRGDVYDLEANSTPLDFAYLIHTEVGHRCRGAKVNGKLVQLTHKLQTGDRVEIMTAKESKPSRDWLNTSLGYLHSSQAINKVRHWFNKQNYQENLNAGQALWEKAARRANATKVNLTTMAKRFNFKTADDLLAAIGAGDLSTANVLQHMRKKELTPKTDAPVIEKTIKTPPKATDIKDSKLSIEGVGNLLTSMAKCCKPIPGDEIIGYITQGRGITIHQQSCHNIRQALTYRPERVVEVNWSGTQEAAYPVDLMIEAEDRAALLRDITNVIASNNIQLLGISSRVDKIKGLVYINLTMEINALESLTTVQNQLRQVSNVINVSRL